MLLGAVSLDVVHQKRTYSTGSTKVLYGIYSTQMDTETVAGKWRESEHHITKPE